MNPETEDFLGELRLGKRLITIGHVAARGLVLILGLIFLVPGRAQDLVGYISAGAALVTFLILGMTVLNVVEMLEGSRELGGSYPMIHETLGGMGGFFAGWSLLAGSIALTAAFIQAATGSLILLFDGLNEATDYLAPGIFILLVLIQLFRLPPRREVLWPIVRILYLMLGVVILSILLPGDLKFNFTASTFVPGNFMRAAGWISISYAAIEAVLASRRQIRDPAHALPRGLLTTLLIGGFAFIAIEFINSGILPTVSLEGEAGFTNSFGTNGLLPSWVTYSIAAISLLLAANTSIMLGARQVHALSRHGALPDFLRTLRPPFRVQPFIFGLIFIVTGPLILFAPTEWLMNIAAVLFIVSMLLLNLAAIQSRLSEPERRRSFTVPFFPLIPVAAFAVGVVTLLATPFTGILSGGIWLLIGLGIYIVYSRTHLMEAQEGVLVFGRESDREKREGAYRILVPISAGVERHLLLDIATALARQADGEVIPLQVIPIADPLAIAEGQRIARERNTLFQWSTREAVRSGVPTFPITRLARSVQEGILDTADEEECDLILLPWTIRSDRQDGRMGRVLDPVVRRAPCDVAVFAIHADRMSAVEESFLAMEKTADDAEVGAKRRSMLQIKRILVTTAGGPHAPLATRLALLLARDYGATTEAVYVADPDASQEELAEGSVWIQRTIDSMHEQMKDLTELYGELELMEAIPIESRVVTAESVVDGIAQAGAECDLVFLGASEESLIDQVLFGIIPEQVAKVCPSPVIMVKRFRGLSRFWLQRVWNTLFETLPTLSRVEQVSIYKQVQSGARPDVDFFVMIGLSAIIATYGLLQDSSAVIIGAMLVAPLFTPILALSLGIVRGDIRLLRLAVESTLKGVALAIGLAIFLTAISPLRTVTHEIAARTHPNLFDLAVALASGAAGAYAVARKDVATALPGVAIAAALVPPLGVVGIGLAIGDPSIAGGGGLLFITNLIAITLVSSITLLLLGFRPTARAERERLRFGLVASLVLLTIIAIPMAVVFVDSVQESRVRHMIDEVLTQQLGNKSDIELGDFSFEVQDNRVEVTITVYARQTISEQLAMTVRDQLANVLNRPTQLHIMSIPIMDVKVPVP